MTKVTPPLMVSIPMPSYIQSFLIDNLRLSDSEAMNVYKSYLEAIINDPYGDIYEDFVWWVKESDYAHLIKDNQ